MINVNSDHKRGIDKSTVFPTGRAGKATTFPIASKNIAGEGLGKEVNGNLDVTNNVMERVLEHLYHALYAFILLPWLWCGSSCGQFIRGDDRVDTKASPLLLNDFCNLEGLI